MSYLTLYERARRFTVSELWPIRPHVCCLCGQTLDRAEATVEHLTPRAHGGRDHITNVSLSHFGCNQQRGHRPLESIPA